MGFPRTAQTTYGTFRRSCKITCGFSKNKLEPTSVSLLSPECLYGIDNVVTNRFVTHMYYADNVVFAYKSLPNLLFGVLCLSGDQSHPVCATKNKPSCLLHLLDWFIGSCGFSTLERRPEFWVLHLGAHLGLGKPRTQYQPQREVSSAGIESMVSVVCLYSVSVPVRAQ